jgi:hypothetical protein
LYSLSSFILDLTYLSNDWHRTSRWKIKIDSLDISRNDLNVQRSRLAQIGPRLVRHYFLGLYLVIFTVLLSSSGLNLLLSKRSSALAYRGVIAVLQRASSWLLLKDGPVDFARG